MAPPKPDSAQLQHPRRLLMADLQTHLMHYVLDTNCTLVLMGDMNIGLCARVDDDGPALIHLMMTRLGLISCAEARWPDSHRGVLTHRAGDGQAHSHIDYILITESHAASVRRFGIDADDTLMHDFDHAVLFADVDVVKVLRLTPVEEVTTPKRRRSEIRYSDKQRLERFQTFAEQLYEKRGFEAKMQDLIGDVKLDGRLRQQGEDARKEWERRGWDAVHWRCGTGSTDDERGIRWRVDEAMALLDEMATAADVGFAETHGGQKRRRDKSNPKRCGAGYSPCTAEAAKDCTRFRRIIKAVWRERWEEVRTLREESESHEADVPVVIERAERREGMVKELKAALASFRMATHGKVRTNNTLKAGGSKARAQEHKLRAATKREINAVMERPARGTIGTVSTGRGDDMEVITDPVAVAAECCEFGKRCMGSMQPKWFRRYDVATEHEVWFSDGVTAQPGRVTAIDDDGRYTAVWTRQGISTNSSNESRSTTSGSLKRRTATTTTQTRLAWRRVVMGGE